jgi:hypothetical protein
VSRCDDSSDGGLGWLLTDDILKSLPHPLVGKLGLSCMVMVSSPRRLTSSACASGPGTFLPLTVQPSTGTNIVFRLCIGSLGHIRFALRS